MSRSGAGTLDFLRCAGVANRWDFSSVLLLILDRYQRRLTAYDFIIFFHHAVTTGIVGIAASHLVLQSAGIFLSRLRVGPPTPRSGLRSICVDGIYAQNVGYLNQLADNENQIVEKPLLKVSNKLLRVADQEIAISAL
ncbi:hypothetical protein PoB_005168100 [Plakobranchus ocellatus]|uniref:TLC domain-containing protein n=1 Tax=Plakobranchus ocellatus TaxID=259542 RepID=A0AAV4BXB6_9GAST|nr:hypothetical protein PoB_005168100 [Plakobranchus ocellatus]